MHHFAFRSIVVSVFSLALAACGAPSTTDGGTDAGTDVGGDRSLDAPSDVATDLGNDVAADAPADVTNDVPGDQANDVQSDVATDTSPACSASTPCHAFWCGCGSCNPADIVCVSDNRGCPLGCVSSCPEVDTTVCSCNGGACSVVHSDGGTTDASTDVGTDARADASSDGGGLGTPCTGTGDCASGLMCCYPCGIPGCTNQCLTPIGGSCPLFP